MKKISRTIAMILVLIMLASSFTSCLTAMAIDDGYYPLLFLTIPLDILFSPFYLIAIGLGINIFASGETESQIYLANAEYSLFTEYYPLVEKIYSLPETELDSMKQIYNSIPETERISSMEKVTSLSETKRASLIGLYNSLPESEIVASIKRISTLTETERVSLLRAFNSLSDKELDVLIEKFNPRTETENVVLADNYITLPEPNIVSLKNDFQYYNVGRKLWFR